MENLNKLMFRMDIIPVSIAFAQAAKESGWGTSRFAFGRKCNFWSMDLGWKGIEPLKDKSDKTQNFEISNFKSISKSLQK